MKRQVIDALITGISLICVYLIVGCLISGVALQISMLIIPVFWILYALKTFNIIDWPEE